MKIYNARTGEGYDGLPVFTILDGKLYRTVHHPLGWSDAPEYEIGTDGKLYRTAHHRLGKGERPDYEFHRDQQLYRTRFHPEGEEGFPSFILRD
jgi:hypothetical protein